MKSHGSGWVMLPALLTLATLAFPQDRLSRQPCPDLAAESLGCELIVWSDLQEPAPPPDPASFPAQRSDQTTFVGIIMGSNGRYFLQAGDNVLALDDSPLMRRYEGQAVKVTGTFDEDNRRLHIKKVEPFS